MVQKIQKLEEIWQRRQRVIKMLLETATSSPSNRPYMSYHFQGSNDPIWYFKHSA